jgi:chromosome segregation ATPase
MELTNVITSNGTDKSDVLIEIQDVIRSHIEEASVLLRESVSTASNAAQKYEEFRQSSEAKIGQLEAQLQEREESIRSKEHTIKEQEEILPAKIQELELRLTKKENLLSLLEKRNAEITNLRSQIDGFQVFDLSTEVSFQLAERGLCLTETLLPFLEMSQLNDIGSKLDAFRNTFENIVNHKKDDTNAVTKETAPEKSEYWEPKP